MNEGSIRSSQSSYRNPHFSSSSTGNTHRHSSHPIDSYEAELDPAKDEKPMLHPGSQMPPRNSTDNPVAMHLLTVTALVDSAQCEILSFEDIEELKKEFLHLNNRIEASKRKLALEIKLKDAALSLKRLFGNNGDVHTNNTPNPSTSDDKRSNYGDAYIPETSYLSNEELVLSTRRCEKVSLEIAQLEQKSSVLRVRILEHTAGVLQMTHKGLKKNRFKGRIQTRMTEEQQIVTLEGDDFDTRILYKAADYTHVAQQENVIVDHQNIDAGALRAVEHKFTQLTRRFQEMSAQTNTGLEIGTITPVNFNDTSTSIIDIHIAYLEKWLESMPPQLCQTIQELKYSLGHTEETLDILIGRVDDILTMAGGNRQTNGLLKLETKRTLNEQLEYLGGGITDAEKRIENLIQQKTILSTQIQQQRDLNSKSDAERDSCIADLNTEIVQVRKELEVSKLEAESAREELIVVMDQFDASRRESMIREQKRVADEAQTADSERESKLKVEEGLQEKERHIKSLESTLERLRTEKDHEIAVLLGSRTEVQEEMAQLRSEHAALEREMVRVQTELTVAKAELDSAYGSRAERAAEAAINPAIQQEIAELSHKNMELTKEIAALKTEPVINSKSANSELQERIHILENELREAVDEYEDLTKASIKLEKERDKLETIIDSYRDRCDTLEAQLSDEKIQNFGLGSPSRGSCDGISSETTSVVVLKKEFKKMVRDIRAESTRVVKAEQEERRRLEALLRTLAKEQ
ncbi:hypothetical protein FQN57_002937 [Myotisia sp. PD_48]|nr:hypothetical protein FQN57_002937 [Myotisia sp. PD_48]